MGYPTGDSCRSALPTAHRSSASHFKRARVFRLSDPESVRYRQVLICRAFGGRAERETTSVTAGPGEGRYRFTTLRTRVRELPELTDFVQDDPYAVPTSGLTIRNLSRACLSMNWMDLVANLAAYRQTAHSSPWNQPLSE